VVFNRYQRMFFKYSIFALGMLMKNQCDVNVLPRNRSVILIQFFYIEAFLKFMFRFKLDD
jgi:hypothetical protein